MDFFETVEKRGSYRGPFLDREIPEADIRKILEAGLRAPSGYNMQTTSFIVVRDAAVRDQIAQMMPTPATKSAPVMIVSVTEKKVNNAEGAAHFEFEVEDYGAAVENILLAITALGYAAVWMDGNTRKHEKNKKIAALLGVPEDKTVRSVIPLGIPENEVVQRDKKPFDERVMWEKYKQ